jgi:hypothetical protein
MNLIVQRFTGQEILRLHGRVLRTLRPDSTRERVLSSADDLVRVLNRQFGLDVPEAASLWPRVMARHEELFETPVLSATRKPVHLTSTAPRPSASRRVPPLSASRPGEPPPQRR